MSHIGRMLDHRRWRRDRRRHGPERIRPVVRRSDEDWEPPQPSSPQQQPEANQAQLQSSSPQTNKSTRTSGTDPTLDHSFLSESTAHEPGAAAARPPVKSAAARRQRVTQGRNGGHDHDCDNSSITSHRTSDEERPHAASPQIPRVVSGRAADGGQFSLLHGNGGRSNGLLPVEALPMIQQVYAPLMTHDPAASRPDREQDAQPLARRSDEALSSATTTAASTQVATNRALDLALQRIRHMQAQLHDEYARLDALVLASQRAMEAGDPSQNEAGESLPFQSEPLVQVREKPSLDETVKSVGSNKAAGETSPMGKLGHHIQRMQGRLLSTEGESYQSRSISSSVKAEINLNPPSRVPAAMKVQSHQEHATPEENSNEEARHNHLSLPALSQDPTTPRTFETKSFASKESTDALSPPRIQRYVFRQGINLASNASSPDPVFCAASVGTTSQTSNATPHSEAKAFQLVQQTHPMLSPESLLTGTVASQPSKMGSDMATFMHASTPESSIRGADRERHVPDSHRTRQECNKSDQLPALHSSGRKNVIRYWERLNGSGEHGSTERNPSLPQRMLDHKIQTERRARIDSHVSKRMAENSDHHIDSRSIDVQSLRSALESNHASVGSFKIAVEEEADDDVSVRSLKERFEAPAQAPSTVSAMMERFEQKKRAVAANQHFKQTLSKFGGPTIRRMSGTALTRKLEQRPHVVADDRMSEPEPEPDRKESPAKSASVKDRIKAFEASDKSLTHSTMARSNYPKVTDSDSITVPSECSALQRNKAIDSAAWHSVLPPQRSGLEVYRESLSKSYFSAASQARSTTASTFMKTHSPVVSTPEKSGPAIPPVQSAFVSTNFISEERRFEKNDSNNQADLDLEVLPGSSLSKTTENRTVETTACVSPSSEKGMYRPSPISSETSVHLGCSSQPGALAKIYDEEGSNNIIQQDQTPSFPNVVKPTPIKIVNNWHGGISNFHDPKTTAFRPISIASSGTSLSRFSHSSIQITERLLKFSEKAKLAAMNSQPSPMKSTKQQAHDIRVASSLTGNRKSTTEKLGSTETNVQSGHKDGSLISTSYHYKSPFRSSSSNGFIDEKKEDNFDDDSMEDSSDGITLDASIAEVSNLTTPTALVSKAEQPKGRIALVQDEESSASSSESPVPADDLSSDQSSEAAAPLLAQTMGTQPLSDDLSECANNFMVRSGENSAKRMASSKPRAKTVTFKEDLKEEDAWDTARIRSVFPVVSSKRPAKTDDIFSLNNVADDFLPGFSDPTTSSKATGKVDKSRATTPTRSNRSVLMIPTRRRYTATSAAALDEFSAHQDDVQEFAFVSGSMKKSVSRDNSTTAKISPSLPFSGPQVYAADLRIEPKHSTPSGFPSSRQLRNHVHQMFERNRSWSAAAPSDPFGFDQRSSVSSTFTRFNDEHATLISRLQRLREARLKRGATRQSYAPSQRRYYSRKNEFDEMSGSTQSSTRFGGRAFLASLDVD